MTKKNTPNKLLTNQELLNKIESKVYENKPKTEEQKFEELVKNKMNNFDKFSL